MKHRYWEKAFLGQTNKTRKYRKAKKTKAIWLESNIKSHHRSLTGTQLCASNNSLKVARHLEHKITVKG